MSDGTSAPPTRLILCVDGESQISSLVDKSSKGKLTNIQRIQAGITRGNCSNTSDGSTYNQVVQYVPGIGSSDDGALKGVIQATLAGGSPLVKQIQEVFESCSRLTGSRDEVWLFGFSKGAFVVRAVAGLLHTFGSLASAGQPEFAKDFKKLLKDVEQTSGTTSLALSPVSSTTTLNRRPAPKIQFVGVFDTVSVGSEGAAFDIGLNASCQHLRHAVALNEDRKSFSAELMYPEQLYGTKLADSQRSFIQALFIGNHNDMGGTGKKGGLALYPLQWMMSEARQGGLFLTCFDGGLGEATRLGADPLAVVFPKANRARGGWTNNTANGISIQMQDLRDIHEQSHHQFGITLGSKFEPVWKKKFREPFDKNGTLQGFCDWAPQGTILHPSVYLLIDEHANLALENKESNLHQYIESYRVRMLGYDNHGMLNEPWGDDMVDDSSNPGAIRVLVCGNTGVGKSTLINKTFGVDVTKSQSRCRGIHDVREEITFEGRPDLIVHDSGGFEAGADDEFLAIEAFLKQKSAAVDVMERLHVIWFCVDINSPRTLQTATEKLFQAVGQYASDVPIIVVATKKDDFLDIEFGARRKAMKKEGLRFDEEACEEYAEGKLQERVDMIKEEMQTVPGGRLDACIAISQDDDNSIKELSTITSRCFDTDKIRALYIRAQVSRIDLKIDLAIAEIIKRYKKLVRSTTGSVFAAGGSTINKNITTNNVCKAIINCFGLPTVSGKAAIDALKANVWNNSGTNVGLALADAFQAIGVTGTVFAAGIPAWAVTGAISTPYVVPATCRLFLISACDLTFVLARSFKENTFRSSGQPTERDVSAAARVYRLRGYSEHIHSHIKRLVPRRNLAAAYKIEAIRQAVEEIFASYKDKLIQDVELPKKVNLLRLGSDAGSDTTSINSSEADTALLSDFKDVKTAYATQSRSPTEPDESPLDFRSVLESFSSRPTTGVQELDGSRDAQAIAELDASTPVAEMDASEPIYEMPADTKTLPYRNAVEQRPSAW